MPLDAARKSANPVAAIFGNSKVSIQHVLDTCWTDGGSDNGLRHHVELPLGAGRPEVSEPAERLETAIAGELTEQLDPRI